MKKYLLIVATLLGFAFDILFWRKTPGISFFIFVMLCLVLGFFLIKADHLLPAKTSLMLIIPIFFLSVMSFIRKEPLTTFLNISLTLFFMAVMAMTYLGGQWLSFGIADYVANFFRFIGGIISLPFLASPDKDSLEGRSGSSTWLKNAKPVIRGVFLAIPVILIFTAFFSSADLVFAKRLTDLAANLNLEHLPEYLFRGFLILVVAFFFTGIIIYAVKRSSALRLLGKVKPIVPPFLGFTETSIILVGVLLLFGTFVLIQFEYFFFGPTNITQQGFTYSEYARRGFGELVAVAVFSIALIKSLSEITKLNTKKKTKIFSGLTTCLVSLVLIILVSAFQRLYLYESAYGFSRSRAYAHVFIIWLGIFLLAVVIMEIFHCQRSFANIALAVILGFSFSLNLLNVDRFIVRNNINRTIQGEVLDVSYLSSLSSDAIPTLVSDFSSDRLSSKIQEEVGAALVCYQERIKTIEDTLENWQSFHLSNRIAEQNLQIIQKDLNLYSVDDRNLPILVVSPDGNDYACENTLALD